MVVQRQTVLSAGEEGKLDSICLKMAIVRRLLKYCEYMYFT